MKQLCVPKALETCLHRKHTFKYIEPTATFRVFFTLIYVISENITADIYFIFGVFL